MRSLKQISGWQTAAVLLALTASLFLVHCGIHPSGDDSAGRTAVVLQLNPAEQESGQLASGQAAAETARLEALIQITGPGLSEPLNYLIHDLQFGSGRTLWVPSGSSRTFEVWVYQIPSAAERNTFPATLLVTITPPALRTVDLAGERVNLTLQVAPTTELGSVGSYNQTGLLQIAALSEADLVPGDCGIVLEVVFVDPAFDNLALGPTRIEVGPNDGEYLITGVPLGRKYQLLVQHAWNGWTGESEQFTASSDSAPNPVPILLTGYQPLQLLSNPYDYVADGLPIKTASFQVAGGSGTYHFFSELSNLGYASISNTGVYSVLGTLYSETIDPVTISDACFENDYTIAEVYWFLAPMLIETDGSALWPYDGSVLGGDHVYISGMGFDSTTQVFFGEVLAPTINFIAYDQLEAITPPHAEGWVDVRVWNPRSNPLFPDFTGFAFTANNVFEYLSGGMNKFYLPVVGDPSQYTYTP